jgi:hypothetical protein
VSDGWGVSADDCARAMRCTPTMVRRARLAEMRHPDNGYVLPDGHDPITWAVELDSIGLTLRQIEAVTGVPRTTLHYRLTKARRPVRKSGTGQRAIR